MASFPSVEEFYTSKNGNAFYKENDTKRLLNYYGVDCEFKLGVVVNGLTKDENLSKVDKIFESIHIEANENEFSRMNFRTRNQNSMLVPFVSEEKFWRNPKYELSKWVIPVPSQKSNSSFIVQGAEMMGTWMEIIIVNESFVDFYIKNIETVYNIEL